jgi:hypothetical protein
VSTRDDTYEGLPFMTDTFTSSPFVTAIEPITETDDEIRAFLADAEVPPLLPAIA